MRIKEVNTAEALNIVPGESNGIYRAPVLSEV